MISRSLIAFFLTACQTVLFAQSSLTGVIKDGVDPMPYVFVSLQGTSIASSSDISGKFELKGISSGEYTLVIQFMGYKPIKREIKIGASPINLGVIPMERDVLGLDEFVVTANRDQESARQSTVVVDVLNKQQLERISAVTFSDGIKFSPGIRTETNCQNCGFSQVRINGLPGSYSQILIDGRATFSALNSIYGLDQIPVEMIDRIEVVKGGGSALYGSNAIAGTINIITNDPVKNEASVKMESGVVNGKSFDNVIGFYGAVVNKNFQNGISVFGSHRNRDEYDHNGDGYSELPRLRNIGMGARAFQRTGSWGKLNVEFHGLQEFRRGGNLIDLEPHEADIAEELRSSVFGGGLSWDMFSKNKKHKWSLFSSAQQTTMNNYYGAGRDVNGYGKTNDLSWVSGLQYNYEHTSILNGEGKLVAGSEFKWNDMADEKPGYNLFIDQRLRTLGTFAQYEVFFSKVFKVSVGGRYDWYNLKDQGNFSPRVNLLYSVSDQIRIRAGYARGFRIPQIFSEDVHVELVAGEIQAIQLAPDLNAELSDSYTLTFDFDKDLNKGEMEVVVEGFYTRLHNPFVLEEVPGADQGMILERRNGSGAGVVGTNVEFNITDNRMWALTSSVTLLQTRHDEPVQWSSEVESKNLTNSFFRTPNLYGNVALDIYPIKKMIVVLTGLYTGPMWVQHYAGYISNDELKRTQDFFELGIKCQYDFSFNKMHTLSAFAGVKNIFNSYQSDFDIGPLRDASYVYGPQQPRTFFLGLKYRLN